MSKKRMAAFGAVGVGVLALVAPPASAGDGFTVTPTSGPVGTVISISGTGCYDEGLPDRTVSMYLTNGLTGQTNLVTPDDNGAWSGHITVSGGLDPDLDYYVAASCWGEILGDNGQVIQEYGPVDFDVTGDGPVPTTPTTQPPTEPTTPTEPTVPGEPPAEPEVPTPPPATPIVDEPDFTG